MGLTIVSSQGGMSDSARGIFSFTLSLTERSSFLIARLLRPSGLFFSSGFPSLFADGNYAVDRCPVLTSTLPSFFVPVSTSV
jgi:hypothetical protein